MNEPVDHGEQWEWSLGSWTATDGGPHLTIGRVLSDDERKELQRDAAFIRTLASGATYPHAVTAINDLIKKVRKLSDREASERSPVDMDALGPAFLQAARLLVNVPDRIESEIDAFPVAPEVAEQIQNSLSSIADAQPLTLCRRLAENNATSVSVVGTQGDARLMLEEPEIDALALLHSAANVVQRMLAQRLVDVAEETRNASQRLRIATAEVLDGAPSLIRHRPLTDENLDLRDLQPHDLALSLITPLQQMIRRAHEFLDNALVRGGDAGAKEEEQRVDFESPPTQSATGTVKPKEEVTPVVDEGLLDLKALLQHLLRLDTELEHAWSAALDTVITDEALEETRAEWSSLFAALQRSATLDNRRAESLGLDPNLPPELLAPEVDAIQLDPSLEHAWKQAEVAYIYAMQQLVVAPHPLLRHPQNQITLNNGSVISQRKLWNSGAFAQVRATALFFARVYEERAKLENQLASGGEKTGSSTVSEGFGEVLSLVHSAVERGDPHAVILHLNRFFKHHVQALPPGGATTEAAAAMQLIENAAGRIGRGEQLSLAALTLTAVTGTRTLALLVQPPADAPSEESEANESKSGSDET